MNVREALTVLGVNDQTLSQPQKDKLDQDGYPPQSNILSPAQIPRIVERTDAMVAAEGENAGKEVHQEPGTYRLSDLVNKDPIFEICFTHPRVLAAIDHVLGGDLRLSSLNYRAALPSSGLLGLHADCGSAVESGDYYVCNSIWLLDDFTELNGAARVVPGSQRSGKISRDVMPDHLGPSKAKLLFSGDPCLLVLRGYPENRQNLPLPFFAHLVYTPSSYIPRSV